MRDLKIKKHFVWDGNNHEQLAKFLKCDEVNVNSDNVVFGWRNQEEVFYIYDGDTMRLHAEDSFEQQIYPDDNLIIQTNDGKYYSCVELKRGLNE